MSFFLLVRNEYLLKFKITLLKKINFLFCLMLLSGLTSSGQPFFTLDSIRHPNCHSTTGHAYYTLFFQPVPGPILVKGALIPGMEFETFDAIAAISDTNTNGTEHYTFSMQAEGDLRLYFVYPALHRIDSSDFHFNSHLLNISGGFSGLVSCDSISPSAISFVEGTPPYKLYMTNDNWQSTTLIGNYFSSNPSVQIDVPIPLPEGHYQFKLVDKYCEMLYPEPIADFSVWGIGVFAPGFWISACPEIAGDTAILTGTSSFSRSLTVISAGIFTKWEDTLMVTVNFGDGSPAETFINTVGHWQVPFNIVHTYSTTGIFEIHYVIKNTRVALITTSYIYGSSEFVNIGTVSVGEADQNNKETLIFPNPVENNLNVFIYSENTEIARFLILNNTGQTVFDKEIILNKGRNLFNIPLYFLNNGIYTLQTIINRDVKSKKGYSEVR